MGEIKNIIYNVDGNLNLWGKLALSLLVLLISQFILIILRKTFEKILLKDVKYGDKKRFETIFRLIGNVLKVIIFFIAITIILDLFGINTSSIIATAGVGSIAIGFGAQSLVKDAITGLFILIENQYVIGDYIEIDPFSGIVEDFSLRLTKLRDLNGDLHMIPNGQITSITNMSRGFRNTHLKYSVSFSTNLIQLIDKLNEALNSLKDNKKIVSGPTVMGISSVKDTGIEIQVTFSTNSLDQWEISRLVNKKVEETFVALDVIPPAGAIRVVERGN